ncbi:uracil-DNA glycosylase [Solimonas terrae]|uniref:Uracil-DNA glycosylase n=1 Tax=Solimonas terrae TaxID=1396819 RepID=A0A6M2BSP7_9GAMM|nr:uracil-DNA glycosylase [Solimonas terrae]NGY05616.1 uracil-DNA glycosylase [Solimonas terrae]
MKTIDRFLARLAAVQLENVFNPYRDICPIHDHAESAQIRLQSLRAYLTLAVQQGVDSIWFGRDLGHRGGRRTGIALTDEKHLPLLAARLHTRGIRKATASEMVIERTATVVWSMVEEIGQLPFMWNAFPLHPHEAKAPLSNRSHTRGELSQIWSFNMELVDVLKPRHFVAIGNDAHVALANAGLPCSYVRHPSYGGQADFVAGLRRIYSEHCAANRTGALASQLELID